MFPIILLKLKQTMNLFLAIITTKLPLSKLPQKISPKKSLNHCSICLSNNNKIFSDITRMESTEDEIYTDLITVA